MQKRKTGQQSTARGGHALRGFICLVLLPRQSDPTPPLLFERSLQNSYIARSRVPGETITVLAQVEASRPRNFSPAMGRALANESAWPWGAGELPLPYPPAAVRCVLLERDRKLATGEAGEPLRQVIFVSYHSDELFRSGWLTHEGPQEVFTPELEANLDAIGCDLGIK